MVVDILASTVSLQRDVEDASNKLDEMADHMVGAVTQGNLLADGLEKMGELGVEAISQLTEAFAGLVEHTISTGNSIYEMSLKTGASVENLSALRYVAGQTGIDFDSFGNTLFKMEQAMGTAGGASAKVKGALDDLGLSLDTLKNEKPDQAFIDIMSALEEMPNRMQAAADGAAIFGKGFKDMAGLTQESITDLIQEAQDLGLVMTTDQAAAAHAAEVGWKAFTAQLEAAAMAIGAVVMPALVAFEQLASSAFQSLLASYSSATSTINQGGLQTAIITIGEAFINGIAAAAGFVQGAIDGLQNVTNFAIRTGEAIINVGAALIKVGTLGTVDEAGKTFLDKTQAALHATFDALEALKGGMNSAGGVVSSAFGAMQTAADSMAGKFGTAFTAAQSKIQDFADKSQNAFGGMSTDTGTATGKLTAFEKAVEDVNSAGSSWQQTIDGIDGSIVAWAEDLLKSGVSAQTVATYYGLTAVQVKALEQAVKDQAATEKQAAADNLADAEQTIKNNDKIAESWSSTQDKITAIWDQAYSYHQEQGLKGLDLELARLAQRESAEKESATRTIQNETQLQEMLDAIDFKYEGLRADATTTAAQKVTAQTSQLWIQYYDLLDKSAMSATQLQIAEVEKWYDSAVQKAHDAGISDQAYYTALAALAQAKMQDVLNAHNNVFQAIKALQTNLAEGWATTFQKTLVSTGSFEGAFVSIFDSLKTDVENVFASLLASILKGFLQPLLDQVSSVASSIEKMLIQAFTGSDLGGYASLIPSVGGPAGAVAGMPSALPGAVPTVGAPAAGTATDATSLATTTTAQELVGLGLLAAPVAFGLLYGSWEDQQTLVNQARSQLALYGGQLKQFEDEGNVYSVQLMSQMFHQGINLQGNWQDWAPALAAAADNWLAAQQASGQQTPDSNIDPTTGLPRATMASGGYGMATAPMLFYTGGDEEFAFSGEGQRFGSGGGDIIVAPGAIVINNPIMNDATSRAAVLSLVQTELVKQLNMMSKRNVT